MPAGSVLAVLLLLAQSQIGSVGRAVEVQDSSGSAPAIAGQLVIAPETVRTGAGSFVDIVPAVNTHVLVNAESQIEVRQLGASPLIWLESGTVKVSSENVNLQIQTKSGLFSVAEWPFEMEVRNTGGSVNVSVMQGRVKTQNLDAAAVTFGAPSNGAYRTYTTGVINPRTETAAPSPNLYVQQCIPPGTPGNTGPGRPPGQH